MLEGIQGMDSCSAIPASIAPAPIVPEHVFHGSTLPWGLHPQQETIDQIFPGQGQEGTVSVLNRKEIYRSRSRMELRCSFGPRAPNLDLSWCTICPITLSDIGPQPTTQPLHVHGYPWSRGVLPMAMYSNCQGETAEHTEAAPQPISLQAVGGHLLHLTRALRLESGQLQPVKASMDARKSAALETCAVQTGPSLDVD
jgi:hypothetical protein